MDSCITTLFQYLEFFSKPESRPPEKLVAWFEETAKHKPLQIIPPKPDYFRCSVFSEETESAWRTSQ